MCFAFLIGPGINVLAQNTTQEVQQRTEIEKSTAELRYLSAKLKTDQRAYADAQAALEASKGKVVNYQDLKNIQDRIQSATLEIHEDTLGISRNVSLLRVHWNNLTQDEKTLVLEVEQTQM
jgi:hypothetical protein